jgi:hypothetical protein
VATSIAITATITVPAKIVRTSNSLARGNHPSVHSHPRWMSNSHWIALSISASTIAMLITRPRTAALRKKIRTARSRRWRRLLPRMSSRVIGCLVAVALMAR